MDVWTDWLIECDYWEEYSGQPSAILSVADQPPADDWNGITSVTSTRWGHERMSWAKSRFGTNTGSVSKTRYAERRWSWMETDGSYRHDSRSASRCGDYD